MLKERRFYNRFNNRLLQTATHTYILPHSYLTCSKALSIGVSPPVISITLYLVAGTSEHLQVPVQHLELDLIETQNY